MNAVMYKAALIAIIVAGLSGCGQNEQEKKDEEKKSQQQEAHKRATSSHIKPGDDKGW